MAKKLTIKQESFCYKYIENGGNASAAYRHAYDAQNMKEETVTNNAYKLLQDNDVATMVDELKAEIKEEHKVTKESLAIMVLIFKGLKVDKENCQKALTDEVYATEKVYKLVKEGIPFREAYKTVSEKY